MENEELERYSGKLLYKYTVKSTTFNDVNCLLEIFDFG